MLCPLSDSDEESESDTVLVTKTFTHPLSFMNKPIFTTNGLLSQSWETGMISRRVRVTRRELLTIVCSKLGMADTREHRTRLMRRLTWTFSGVLEESRDGLRRKFVGLSSSHPRRRDFVRIKGSQNGTCLSAELYMFVVISGFDEDTRNGGIVLPKSLCNPHLKDRSVEFAFIRCLNNIYLLFKTYIYYFKRTFTICNTHLHFKLKFTVHKFNCFSWIFTV